MGNIRGIITRKTKDLSFFRLLRNNRVEGKSFPIKLMKEIAKAINKHVLAQPLISKDNIGVKHTVNAIMKLL